MVLCKDCKWFTDGGPKYSKCSSPRAATFEVVTGAKRIRWSHCDLQREDGWLMRYAMNTCGRGARWFEPAPPQTDSREG